MEKIRCKRCRKQIYEELRFCPHCGEKQYQPLDKTDLNKDPYKILQISPDAEDEVIKAAYKSLAKKYHPDTQQGTLDDDRMKEINWAFDILSDPEKKRQWDKEHGNLKTENEGRTPSWNSEYIDNKKDLKSDPYGGNGGSADPLGKQSRETKKKTKRNSQPVTEEDIQEQNLNDQKRGFWFIYKEGLVVTAFFYFCSVLSSFIDSLGGGYSLGSLLCSVPIATLITNFIIGVPSIWLARKLTKQRIAYLFLAFLIVLIVLFGVIAIAVMVMFATEGF